MYSSFSWQGKCSFGGSRDMQYHAMIVCNYYSCTVSRRMCQLHHLKLTSFGGSGAAATGAEGYAPCTHSSHDIHIMIINHLDPRASKYRKSVSSVKSSPVLSGLLNSCGEGTSIEKRLQANGFLRTGIYKSKKTRDTFIGLILIHPVTSSCCA